MNFVDIAALVVLALIIGGAVAYIVRSKKRGKKCIGCPDCGSCGNCKGKPEEKNGKDADVGTDRRL